jgi:hypothetical protein
MLRTTTRKATAVVAALVITAGAGAATAAALTDSSDDAQVAAAPAALDVATPVTDVPVRPAPHYNALERSAQKPTARVAQMQRVLAARYPDLTGRSVRGLKAADGTQAWVVSGSKHTCLGADNSDGTGYTCRPNDEALDGITVAEKRPDGTQRTVLLVPDDIASVTAGGRVAAAKNNLVIAEHRVGATVQANPSDGGSPFRVGTE